MKPLTSEQIQKAKQIDLLTYMKMYRPNELVKDSAHDYRTKTHSSLVISDNGLWHWYKKDIGGKTALNYLILVEGMGFVEAVRSLTDGAILPAPNFHDEDKTPSRKQRSRLEKPTPDESNKKAAAYLRSRCINSEVLRFCYTHKLLYQSSHNGMANCVFLGLDDTGQARSATVRGCSGKYRGNATGSDKEYGFLIPASDQDCATLELYESPIDAMSGASLRILTGNEDWRSVHYLAMGGLNYLAVDRFLQQNTGIDSIMLCVDNDEAGRVFSEKFTCKYTELGYEVVVVPPTLGKDYNDTLVAYSKEKQQHRDER